ncbi:MAG: MerR family transcriptional regulator [Bacteroidia bacterium]
MGTYAIKDLEYLSGVKAHTIRIWEQRYNIITPKRTSTNIRNYDDADLRKLLNVSFLNRHGHKISKISKLSYQEIVELVDKISINSSEFDTQIGSMILAMVNLDELRFNQILGTHILEKGFESASINIIFPFLERVGILWQTGDINPAQEHFISGLIRQKLLAAIDLLPLKTHQAIAKIILFLPEGEWHEIGLLFAYYMFKKRGFRVLYLGQSLPMEDLKNTVRLFVPHVLVSSITTFPAAEKTVEYAANLVQSFPTCKILLSGAQILYQKDKIIPYAIVLDNVHSLTQWMNQYAEEQRSGQKQN